MFKKFLFLFIIFVLIISCRRAVMRPTLGSMGSPPEDPNAPVIDEKPETEVVPEEFIIKATDTKEEIENKIQKYYEEYQEYVALVEDTEENINANDTLTTINEVIDSGVFSDGVLLDLTKTTITEIAAYFRGNKYLYIIMLPETLTSIGDYAFTDAAKLIFIDFPSSLREIGNNAFEGCLSLKEVNLEYTAITVLNQNVFNQCDNLNKVVLPYGLLSIENNAFSYCSSLEEIIFPKGVQVIKEQAFFECTSLKKVNLNEGIQSIYNMAFDGCTSLSSISLPSSLQQIGITGAYVFSYTGLSKVEYLGTDPDAIIYTKNVFGDSNLENLYLPNVEEPSDTTIKDKWEEFLGYNWAGKIHYKTSMPSE